MAIYRKSVPKPPSAAPPRATAGDKRTFDMRPKPSDHRRHDEPLYRPPQYPDIELDIPLADDDSE